MAVNLFCFTSTLDFWFSVRTSAAYALIPFYDDGWQQRIVYKSLATLNQTRSDSAGTDRQMGMALGRMVRTKQFFLLSLHNRRSRSPGLDLTQTRWSIICLVFTAPVERRAGLEGMWLRNTVGPTIFEFYWKGGCAEENRKLSISNATTILSRRFACASLYTLKFSQKALAS